MILWFTLSHHKSMCRGKTTTLKWGQSAKTGRSRLSSTKLAFPEIHGRAFFAHPPSAKWLQMPQDRGDRQRKGDEIGNSWVWPGLVSDNETVCGVCMWVKWRQHGIESEQVWEGSRHGVECGRMSEESQIRFVARTLLPCISEKHVHTGVGE